MTDRIEKSIDIAAPPEKVWGIIKDFGKLDWNPAISKIESTGGNENNVIADNGAKREAATPSFRLGGEIRPSAFPRSDWMVRPVCTGRSATSGTYRLSVSKRRSTCSPERVSSDIPVQPEASVMASSARYSSARSPTDDALILSGRSLETTVTSYPSAWRLRATARIRESLSPRR